MPLRAKPFFLYLLKQLLASVPPDMFSAMSSMNMTKTMERGLNSPDLPEQPFTTQPAILRYIEVPLGGTVGYQYIDVVWYCIAPSILTTEILKCGLLAATFWYRRRTI